MEISRSTITADFISEREVLCTALDFFGVAIKDSCLDVVRTSNRLVVFTSVDKGADREDGDNY